MIGVIFATVAEAGPFLELSRAVQVYRHPIRFYHTQAKPRILIAISGIGKVAAAVACQTMIREFQVDEIINAGVCGALQSTPGYAPGAIFCVATAVEGDHEAPGFDPAPIISDGKIDWDQRAARLMTYDRPLFDTQLRRTLSATADLVDMEGAAIARVAAMYQIPWTMIKGVTDGAGTKDRATLNKNLAAVSEKIGNLLWQKLKG
jgi:adenosylhomocysteine nucleosidase